MFRDEVVRRVHPLRHASIFIYAPLVIMDTFLLLFTTTILAYKLDAGILVGLIVPAYTLFSSLALPFWGWMADKHGRRLPLFISGILTIIGLLGFASATAPWHLIVASAVRGIGGSAGLLITRVLVADLAPRKAFGERIAALYLTPYVAPLIGSAIAGPLYEIHDRLPFIVAVITETAALFLAAFAIPETIVKRSQPTEVMESEQRKTSRPDQFWKGAKDLFAILRQRGAALYIFVNLMGIVLGTGAFALSSFLLDLDPSPMQFSLAYSGGAVIGFLGLIPFAILSDRIGRKWPVLLGGFLGALTWPLYTLVSGMPNPFLWFLLINSVYSVASVIERPAFLAYFFEWIPAPERGRGLAMSEFLVGLVALGVFWFIYSISFLLGFSLSPIYAMFTPELVFYLVAIAGIATYVVVWAAWKEAPLPEEKWKLRKSTIVLIAAEIILVAMVIIAWLFLARPPSFRSVFLANQIGG